jgi:hypothetical protein
MLGVPRWVRGLAQGVVLYTRGILRVRHLGGRMNNAKAKLPEKSEVQSSCAFEEFKKFMERHLVKGQHDVRMFLDPNGNCYALFCAACDPRMADAMETRH